MTTKNSSKFFANKECEYYPCHKIKDDEELNCLFCYCPLYFLNDCPGNYKIIVKGVKDCSHCILPHSKESRDILLKYIQEQGGF